LPWLAMSSAGHRRDIAVTVTLNHGGQFHWHLCPCEVYQSQCPGGTTHIKHRFTNRVAYGGRYSIAQGRSQRDDLAAAGRDLSQLLLWQPLQQRALEDPTTASRG
jgi:hypothetical protein